MYEEKKRKFPEPLATPSPTFSGGLWENMVPRLVDFRAVPYAVKYCTVLVPTVPRRPRVACLL